ncbi:carbon storage regulator [Pseudomonas khavaziana]|uniref:carbon storage regulator n=1 Tax=Pseudomonas khavaziana TaxID=2842351 RepID=UPI001C3C76DA|nr:carbon storage regulator [Pseudomonas khavaziana]
MLVFTRRPTECLRIEEEVKVKIKKVEGDSVTLEITAPPHVSIVRPERLKRVLRGDSRDR